MKRKTILALLTSLFTACVSPTYTPQPPIDLTPPADYQPTIFDIQVESPASQERLQDARPNIIVVLTDDQPYHTVDYMPTVKNVLMEGGINFTNGFVTTPLCCPSRASLLTGEYVHNHEVYTNRMPMGGAAKFKDGSTVVVWMKEAGYRTAYYGKYLNDYQQVEPRGYVPPGWEEWAAFLGRNIDGDEEAGNLQYYFNFTMSENGTTVEYPRDKTNFSADVVTTKAVDFINAARHEPFFLFVGYYNPHSPYISAPRHNETFRAGSGWDWFQYRPPNFNEEDIRDKPDYMTELSPLSPEKIDIAHRQILRSLLSVDDGVASILNALDKTGLTEKSIVVFLSDNGLTLGDHRFGVSKNCPYEACVKVPFVVYAPGFFPARNDAHLVANIDLAPTFAELAGASIPESVDGRSLVPLLEDANASWREEILLEHWPAEDGVGAIIPEFYAVRTPQWKYVEYVTGEKELYDLVNDPYELTNLAGKWKYSEIQSDLAKRLAELKKE